MAPFQNVTLKCLTEISGIHIGDQQNQVFIQLFACFMPQLKNTLPPTTSTYAPPWCEVVGTRFTNPLTFSPLPVDFRDVYENGNDAQQNFIQNLAIFFCTLFSNHIKDLESVKENHQLLLEAHWYLLGISEVSDVEVWKICLDYWNKLVRRVHWSREPFFLGADVASLMDRPRKSTTNLRLCRLPRRLCWAVRSA